MLYILNHPIDIQLLGILLEITGAFYLARTFLFKNSLKIKIELFGTGSSRLHSPFMSARNSFFSLYRQAVEARIGFFIVVFGLLLEALSLYILPQPIWLSVLGWFIVIFIAEISRLYFSKHDSIEKEYGKQESPTAFPLPPSRP